MRLRQRRWGELAVLAQFARDDAPSSLVHTDPALYRMLRQQITEFRLRGWSCLDVEALQRLDAGARETNTAAGDRRGAARKPRAS